MWMNTCADPAPNVALWSMPKCAALASNKFAACRWSQDGSLLGQRWAVLACCSTGQNDTIYHAHCREANAVLLSFAASVPCACRLQVAETCIASTAFSFLGVGGLTRSFGGQAHLCTAAEFAVCGSLQPQQVCSCVVISPSEPARMQDILSHQN